ncbi:hypothetical protein pb186bvf_018679 [Paramecium bursaria]
MNQDKRQRPESESDDDAMEEEPIEVNQKGTEDIINLEFLFVDPNAEQFSSIKSLINGYLDGISFRSSELTDTIIGQPVIGTMIGVEDSHDIYGFSTILNLGQYQTLQVIQEIYHYITLKSQHYNKQHQKFVEILKTPQQVGLFINERILNLSPQLIPHLHEQLSEDLKWAKNEGEQNLDYQYLLFISKVYKQPNQKQQKKNTQEEYIYQKFEDNLFMKQAEISFIFESQQTKNNGELSNKMGFEQPDLLCYRIVYLIKLNSYLAQVPNVAQQIEM